MEPLGAYLMNSGSCSREAIARAVGIQAELAQKADSKPLGQILLKHCGLASQELETALARMRLDSLRQAPLFQDLPPAALETIAQAAHHTWLPKKTLYISEGSSGQDFCLIVSGRMRVFRTLPDGTHIDLTELGPGESFGEMALLTGNPRSASIESLSPASLLVLSPEEFKRLLAENPYLGSRLLTVLARWLVRSNTDMAASSINEQTLKRFFMAPATREPPELLGTSRIMRQTKLRAQNLAQTDLPILIRGEAGTKKRAWAAYLHSLSSRREEPFFVLDPSSIDNFSPEAVHAPSGTPDAELAQTSLLFGQEAKAFSETTSKKPGLLALAHHGSLVIDGIDKLRPAVQDELAEFLTTGTFRPAGGSGQVRASIWLLATTTADLEGLVANGSFSSRLYELIAGQSLMVPPLRRHKKDLPLLCQSFIDKHARLNTKDVKGMDSRAHSRIMAYSWPYNLEELEIVIRRAVHLAQHETLHNDDVVIATAPVSGKPAYNLLQLDWVKGLFARKRTQNLAQALAGVAFGLIIGLGLFGDIPGSGQWTLIMTWGIWEPALILSTFFLARLWCAVCPIGALSGLIGNGLGFKKDLTEWLKRFGPFLAAAGLAAVFWSEIAFDMHQSPKNTAVLLLSIGLAAAIPALLFQRRVFCRSLCPLGAMVGLLSSSSIIEMRSNYGICNNQCTDHRCYTEKNPATACPVYKAPFLLSSNLDCLFCGNCIRTCQHQAAELNLRPPGFELTRQTSIHPLLPLFAVTLLGTQIFRGLELAGLLNPVHSSPAAPWVLGLILAGTLLAGFLLMALAGNGLLRLKSWLPGGSASFLAAASIPLLLAFELAYQLESLLAVTGLLTGPEARAAFPADGLPFMVLVGLQLILVLLGLWGSIVIVKRQVDAGGRPPPSIQKADTWPLVLMALVLGLLLGV